MLGTCKAVGEIDIATAPAFEADLRNTIDNTDAVVVCVDCSELTFIDSSGYHALADVHRYASRRGHTMVLQNLPARCAMLIRLCDWAGELHLQQ